MNVYGQLNNNERDRGLQQNLNQILSRKNMTNVYKSRKKILRAELLNGVQTSNNITIQAKGARHSVAKPSLHPKITSPNHEAYVYKKPTISKRSFVVKSLDPPKSIHNDQVESDLLVSQEMSPTDSKESAHKSATKSSLHLQDFTRPIKQLGSTDNILPKKNSSPQLEREIKLMDRYY